MKLAEFTMLTEQTPMSLSNDLRDIRNRTDETIKEFLRSSKEPSEVTVVIESRRLGDAKSSDT